MMQALICGGIAVVFWAVVILFALLRDYREDQEFACRTDAMFAGALGMPLKRYHQEYGKSRARFRDTVWDRWTR